MCKQCKEGIYSLLPISRLMSSQLLKARGSALLRVTWEDKHQTTNLSLLPAFLEFLLLSTTSCGMVSSGPFFQLGTAVLAVSPSNFLCTRIYLLGVKSVKERTPRCCISTVRKHTGVLSNPKHSIIQAAMEKINTIPDRSSMGVKSQRERPL